MVVEPVRYWVVPYCEDGSDRRGRQFSGLSRCSSTGRGNHPHLTTNQIGCHRRQPIELTIRPAVFDRDVAALEIACLTKAPLKRAQTVIRSCTRYAGEKPDQIG